MAFRAPTAGETRKYLMQNDLDSVSIVGVDRNDAPADGQRCRLDGRIVSLCRKPDERREVRKRREGRIDIRRPSSVLDAQ